MLRPASQLSLATNLLQHREKDKDKHGNATRATKSLAPKKKEAAIKNTEGFHPFRASLLMTLMCPWPPHC